MRKSKERGQQCTVAEEGIESPCVYKEVGRTQPKTRANVNKVVKVHPVGRMNVNIGIWLENDRRDRNLFPNRGENAKMQTLHLVH